MSALGANQSDPVLTGAPGAKTLRKLKLIRSNAEDKRQIRMT